jgi:WD40 repeat protein
MRHSDKVESAQFSPDGQRVITVAKDQTVRLWDAATGNPISKRLKYQGRVGSVQFRPDGQRVLITPAGFPTSAGFPAQLWDVTSRRASEEILRPGAAITSPPHFSADGRRVVTTCFDTARVWDTTTGATIGEPIRHENSKIFFARFSPDSKRVVTGSADNSARLWDAITGKPLDRSLKHQDSVLDAKFSPDGQRIITISKDNTARLWDPTIGIQIGEPLKHQAHVSSAEFSPDSRLAVTASFDGTARLWDTATGEAIGKPLNHDGKVHSARFDRDGNRVVTVSYDDANIRVSFWDTVTCNQTGRPLVLQFNVLYLNLLPLNLLPLEFSPDCNRIVVCLLDNTARLWDMTTGMPIGEPLKHKGWVVSAQFSPDGRRLATASKDHTARLWDSATGKALSEPLWHQAEIYSAQFSPDGQRLLTLARDNTARLWDLPAFSSDDAANEDVLADLAQATAGMAVLTAGQADMLNAIRLANISAADISATRDKIRGLSASDSKFTPLQHFLKWCLLDQTSRTISPFSQMTFSEWLENKLQTGTVDELRAAMHADPSNSRLAAYFGRRLADSVLEGRADGIEARRAREEADFQTRRALKLAPGNKEIINLRAEVVQLLGLKSP